jgi:hypothetical protein
MTEGMDAMTIATVADLMWRCKFTALLAAARPATVRFIMPTPARNATATGMGISYNTAL